MRQKNEYPPKICWILHISATFYTRWALMRYANLIWLIVLDMHLYLIGVWSGDDHGTNAIKTCVYKILDRVFKSHINIHIHIVQCHMYERPKLGYKNGRLLFYSFSPFPVKCIFVNFLTTSGKSWYNSKTSSKFKIIVD